MPIKKGREYRALQDFSLIPREGENDAYRVRGTAVVFDSPTCLYEYDGVKYYEVIDRHAFDGCDMSDVIMNYNHGGKVVARLRNKTLSLNITDRGVDMEADLSGTAAGRDLYEEIDGGYIDKMSFSFSVRESKYDNVTHTRTITKIRKLGSDNMIPRGSWLSLEVRPDDLAYISIDLIVQGFIQSRGDNTV